MCYSPPCLSRLELKTGSLLGMENIWSDESHFFMLCCVEQAEEEHCYVLEILRNTIFLTWFKALRHEQRGTNVIVTIGAQYTG